MLLSANSFHFGKTLSSPSLCQDMLTLGSPAGSQDQGPQQLIKETCTSDKTQHESPFTGPWAMSDRSDDILPHSFLSNKRLFVLGKAWLFTGNNTADDSSWQTWWWLEHTTKKTPYCSQKYNTGQNFNPSLHSGWAAFASLTLLLPQGLQTRPRYLRDFMFLFNHSWNPLLHPDNRTSVNCLSQAADSSWLLWHWLEHCKFLKQSFQVFYIQSWGQHGKNRVGSSSHSSGLHKVTTSFGNLAPILDAELSCKPGP